MKEPVLRKTYKRKQGMTIPTPTQQKIIELKESKPNLSHMDLAKIADVSKSAVQKTLAKYGLEQAELESYKSNRSDIFAGLQNRILKSVSDEDIQKASLQVKAMAFGVLYDKERLERNLSTDNTSILARIINDTKAIHSNDNT